MFSIEALAKDINRDNPPVTNQKWVFPAFTLACNMKSEPEVDKIIELVNIYEKSRKSILGWFSGYFQDPDGYYLGSFNKNDMLHR